jgi:hypothetical protein
MTEGNESHAFDCPGQKRRRRLLTIEEGSSLSRANPSRSVSRHGLRIRRWVVRRFGAIESIWWVGIIGLIVMV